MAALQDHARCLQRAHFEFRTREEAAAVARAIASIVPIVPYVEFVLLELMVNAVEHGNLEIGAVRKRELLEQDALEAEVAARLERAPFRDRVASLVLAQRPNGVDFTVGDQGTGFDWRAIAMPDPSARCGRGLALAQAMCPDALRFNATGNIITLRVPWPR